MATDFRKQLNDLEARLKAENEERKRDPLPRDLSLRSPSPRRPKPPGLSFPQNMGFTTTNDTGIQMQPQAVPHNRPSLDGLNTNNTTNTNSQPQGFGNFSQSPSPRRPQMAMNFNPPQSSNSHGTSTGTELQGNMSLNLGGRANHQRPLRRRPDRPFDLPCSPHAQKTPDSVEIEKKYQEIMKQAGILTLDGQKIVTDIGDLQHECDLGHGTCGHVVKMRHKMTRHVMAVKQMRRSGNRDENKRIIMDLDVVIKSHDCPFIVMCLGTFITSSEVWICMELMATCLEKLLKRLKAPFPEYILGKVAVATVKALHYLKEEHGVIHRDIKPSNILIDEKGAIKLCDFGISGRLVDSKAKTRSAGCAAYMAPERIDPPDPTKPDYDIRADVWSLGISLVELATGEFPYTNCKTDFEVLSRVLQEDPPILPPGRGFSMDFCSFVTECLTKDYKKRPKYKKMLEHTFIKRYETLPVDVAKWYADISAMLGAADFTWTI